MFVLDASLALAWCFEDEATDFTTAVLSELPAVGAAVPDIWAYEVSNALWSASSRGRISSEDADELASRLGSLPILRVPLETNRVLDEVRSRDRPELEAVTPAPLSPVRPLPTRLLSIPSPPDHHARTDPLRKSHP